MDGNGQNGGGDGQGGNGNLPPDSIARDIPLDLIDVLPQDRTYFPAAEQANLMDSIREVGQFTPGTVRVNHESPGRYIIVAGERRFRAVQALGLPTFRAFVVDVSEREARRLQALENAGRVNLTIMEQARAALARREEGLTVAQISAEMCLPESTVRDRLALTNLIEEMQHLIAHGHVPVSYGVIMARLSHRAQRIAFLYFAQARSFSLNEFRRLCDSLTAQIDQGRFDDDDDPQVTSSGVVSPKSPDGSADSAVNPPSQGTESRQISDEVGEMQRYLDGWGGHLLIPGKANTIVLGTSTPGPITTKPGQRLYPVRADLPALVKASSAGLALERTLDKLLASDNETYHQAAEVLGHYYNELRLHNLVRTS